MAHVGARIGTLDELLDGTPPAVGAIARRLKSIILEIHPEAVEVVRLGDGAATLGTGPRKMLEGYAYLMPQASWVNLGFYKGAKLPDPTALLEGTGALMRHVKVRNLKVAGSTEVRDLLSAAVEERRAAMALR
jgi:hypothetical protein